MNLLIERDGRPIVGVVYRTKWSLGIACGSRDRLFAANHSAQPSRVHQPERSRELRLRTSFLNLAKTAQPAPGKTNGRFASVFSHGTDAEEIS